MTNSILKLQAICNADESNIVLLATALTNQIALSQPVIDPATGLLYTNETTIDPKTGLPVTYYEVRLEKLEMHYSNLVMTLNGKPFARPAPAMQNYEPSENGVPDDVMAQIRASAQNEWPNDFKMQNFVIKQQTDAWLKLHGGQ